MSETREPLPDESNDPKAEIEKLENKVNDLESKLKLSFQEIEFLKDQNQTYYNSIKMMTSQHNAINNLLTGKGLSQIQINPEPQEQSGDPKKK